MKGLPAVLPLLSEPSGDRPDRMEEACGVFGVLAPDQQVSSLCYFGLYALQHRGQEAAGIAVFQGDRVCLHKDMGLVSQVFDQGVLERMPGSLAIGHNRYSTTGSSSWAPQPEAMAISANATSRPPSERSWAALT